MRLSTWAVNASSQSHHSGHSIYHPSARIYSLIFGAWNRRRLSDDETPDPEEQTFESARAKEVRETLDSPAPREAKIVKLHYGLDGNEPLTLREIGSIFDLSRERIRQIKERAIEWLRHQSRVRRLEPYH